MVGRSEAARVLEHYAHGRAERRFVPFLIGKTYPSHRHQANGVIRSDKSREALYSSDRLKRKLKSVFGNLGFPEIGPE